jgi:hypothetical protein
VAHCNAPVLKYGDCDTEQEYGNQRKKREAGDGSYHGNCSRARYALKLSNIFTDMDVRTNCLSW